MKKLFTTILSLIVVLAMSCTGHAEDTPKVNTIIDKAIKALGGEDKLGKINIVSWKSDTIQYIIPGHDAKWTKITVIQRPDHYRVVSESTIEGKAIKLVIILSQSLGSKSVWKSSSKYSW